MTLVLVFSHVNVLLGNFFILLGFMKNPTYEEDIQHLNIILNNLVRIM